MNMVESLEWAADYAERNHLFAAPLNSRGYVVDTWKSPTPEEKRAIITKLAESACEKSTPTKYHLVESALRCQHRYQIVLPCEGD